MITCEARKHSRAESAHVRRSRAREKQRLYDHVLGTKIFNNMILLPEHFSRRRRKKNLRQLGVFGRSGGASVEGGEADPEARPVNDNYLDD